MKFLIGLLIFGLVPHLAFAQTSAEQALAGVTTDEEAYSRIVPFHDAADFKAQNYDFAIDLSQGSGSVSCVQPASTLSVSVIGPLVVMASNIFGEGSNINLSLVVPPVGQDLQPGQGFVGKLGDDLMLSSNREGQTSGLFVTVTVDKVVIRDARSYAQSQNGGPAPVMCIYPRQAPGQPVPNPGQQGPFQNQN